MSDFQLGQSVRYSTHIRRRHSRPGEFLGPNRIWSTHSGPGFEHQQWEGGRGIIVGKRTLSNGSAEWNYDEPSTYTPKESFTAYLVAFDLHRKPVHVLPEHIEPMTTVADPAVVEFINERTEYVQVCRNTVECDSDYYRWQGHMEARRQLAQKLGYTVPFEVGEQTQPRLT